MRDRHAGAGELIGNRQREKCNSARHSRPPAAVIGVVEPDSVEFAGRGLLLHLDEQIVGRVAIQDQRDVVAGRAAAKYRVFDSMRSLSLILRTIINPCRRPNLRRGQV